jgi:uncharacterized membrane protein YjgN (DUF898 family)
MCFCCSPLSVQLHGLSLLLLLLLLLLVVVNSRARLKGRLLLGEALLQLVVALLQTLAVVGVAPTTLRAGANTNTTSSSSISGAVSPRATSSSSCC